MRYLIVIILLSLVSFTETFAGQFSTEEFSLDVPKGFEEAGSRKLDGTVMYGFSKTSSVPQIRTLLQITSYDFGKSMPNLSKEEMSMGTDKYLLDFLKGVERRRTEFKQSGIVHIPLGGISASKISWHGRLKGLEMSGVMYCVIIGSKIISFHTQDSGNEITPNMLEAIRSIESLTLIQKK